jgi:nucleotide-binding universal stress UspA family protein
MSKPLILIPLDGTLRACAALSVAEALGKVMGATLRVIHVSSEKPPPLSELAGQLGLESAGLHGWSIDARVGEPSAAIISAAQALGARLIIMCTHTAAARPTTVLGHTALEVMRAMPCPVVLVPPAQRFESWRLNRILLPHDGSPSANAAVARAQNRYRTARHSGRNCGGWRANRTRLAHTATLRGPAAARMAQLDGRAS